jgi:hypothetical protein
MLTIFFIFAVATLVAVDAAGVGRAFVRVAESLVLAFALAGLAGAAAVAFIA